MKTLHNVRVIAYCQMQKDCYVLLEYTWCTTGKNLVVYMNLQYSHILLWECYKTSKVLV